MNKRRLVAFLFGSLSVLSLTSVALTVAWYTSSNYNSISPVNVTLRGEPELLVSASTSIESFQKTLTKDSLLKVDEFNPVSSMYSRVWIDKKESYPRFVGDYAHVDSGETPSFTNAGYFSQDIYLYSNYPIYATIDATKFKFSPQEDVNKKTAKSLKERFPTLTEDEILTNLNAITKSLRASVLVVDSPNYGYYIYDPYKGASETYFAGILDSNNDQYFDFDDVQGKEVIYGDYTNKDKAVYQPGSDEDIPYSGVNTCFNAKRKAHIEQFDMEASINNGFSPVVEDSYSPSTIEDALTIRVEAKKPTHIVLSIYLEGWDLDNTNLCEYAAFNADIQFKIKGDIL